MDREPFYRVKVVARPILFAAALLTAASCSPTSERTAPSVPPAAATSPGLPECPSTPELRKSTQDLLDELKKHDGPRYYDVAGVNTTHDDQEWKVGANWTEGTKFHWLLKAANFDDTVNYVLTEEDTVLLDNHPHKSEYGGVFFRFEEYGVVCQPETIYNLRAIIAPMSDGHEQ